jgi:hypothetical protein
MSEITEQFSVKLGDKGSALKFFGRIRFSLYWATKLFALHKPKISEGKQKSYKSSTNYIK